VYLAPDLYLGFETGWLNVKSYSKHEDNSITVEFFNQKSTMKKRTNTIDYNKLNEYISAIKNQTILTPTKYLCQYPCPCSERTFWRYWKVRLNKSKSLEHSLIF